MLHIQSMNNIFFFKNKPKVNENHANAHHKTILQSWVFFKDWKTHKCYNFYSAASKFPAFFFFFFLFFKWQQVIVSLLALKVGITLWKGVIHYNKLTYALTHMPINHMLLICQKWCKFKHLKHLKKMALITQSFPVHLWRLSQFTRKKTSLSHTCLPVFTSFASDKHFHSAAY